MMANDLGLLIPGFDNIHLFTFRLKSILDFLHFHNYIFKITMIVK